MVDVVYTPPTLAISLQWFTKIKYMTDVPLVYLSGGIVVSKETFKQIPTAFQNTLIESSQRHLDQLRNITRDENREAIKVMMKNGVKIITPSQEQIEEFKKLSNRAMDRISGQTFSKNTLNEVTSLLEEYRKGRK
jgi:TRAP-type C4-dicarboxylate transport system substrate-binding protein